MSVLPWFLKHRPKRFTEVEFSDDSNFKVLEWLKTHRNGGLLHITGGIGIGKTSLVYMAAKACKFKVIEYSELSAEQTKALGNRTIDGLSCLILVDEADISSVHFIPKFGDIPVIYTSTNSFQDCIKIMKPDNQLILRIVKRILKNERKNIDDRVILKLCQICSSDIRAVINYCQLFSCVPEFRDFKAIERFPSYSLTYACKLIFSKRLCFEELEGMYSDKLASIAMSNISNRSLDPNSLKSFESFSEIANYSEKYKFISLDHVNKVKIDYEYIKDVPIEEPRKQGHKDPIHFLPFYKRSLQNKASVRHLQRIFLHYNMKDLSGIDKEINEYMDLNVIDSREFKYKFSPGSSCAVKRDISINELLDL